MRKIYTLIVFISLSYLKVSFGQNIGINATGDAPNASAMLDVSATNKGLLIPRVALVAINSNAPIGASVSNSLLVYNTASSGTFPNNVTPGYYWWNESESKWVRLVTSEEIPIYEAGTGLSLSGSTFNSVWTKDGDNIYNNNNGNVGIGTTTPSNKLHIFKAVEGLAIIDQQNTTTNSSIQGTNFWQSFTPSVNGLLTGIDVSKGATASVVSSVIRIYVGEGISGTLLWSGTVDIPTTSGVIHLPIENVRLSEGSKYTFHINSSNTIQLLFSSISLYTGGSFQNGASNDLYFRTYMIPAASSLRIEDGSQGIDKVLTSDALGNATWKNNVNTTYTAGTGLSLTGTTFNSVWTAKGNNIYNNNSERVGIGTTSPTRKLHVVGEANSATIAIDQQNTGRDLNFSTNNIWQSFTAGISGLLTGIDLSKLLTGTNLTSTLNIYVGEGIGGTLLSSTRVNIPAANGVFNISVNGVYLNAGQKYTFQLLSESLWTIQYNNNNPYTLGRSSYHSDYDLYFRTYMGQIQTAIRIEDGNQGIGKVLTSDDQGNATWQTPSIGGSLNDAYNFGGAGLGRSINASSGPVIIEGTSGFQVTGIYGSGDVLDLSGSGTRMFFNPRKAAFRAGNITGAQWNNDSIGGNSFAGGHNTKAYGLYSTAFGYITSAIGQGATALGANTIATGVDATAMGVGANASGRGATAMGGHTFAPSYFETAVGFCNTNYTIYSATAWNALDRLFVIGNGQNESNRSNALVVLKNGNTAIGNIAVPKGRFEINNNIQRQASIVLSGQEYQLMNTNTESGIALLLGVNRPNNKQLWITDQNSVASPNATNPVVRIAPNRTYGVGIIDAFATNGTTPLPLILQELGGFVGIGTLSPTQKLDIDGQIRIRQGNPGVGKVLTSDANGVATWQTPTNYTAGTGLTLSGTTFNSVWTANSNNIYNNNSANVGIGVNAPTQKLDIDGQIRIRQGAPGAGKVLTSDANGVGSWQTPSIGGSLNDAYNFGGAGSGRIINANNGAVEFSKTTQRQANLVIKGQEYYQAGNAGSGIAIMAGVNRAGNKQLWITDFDYVAAPNATNSVIRFMPNSVATIDALATDGVTYLPMRIQSGSGLLGIGRNPTTNKLEVEGNASKTTAGSWLANSDQRLKKNIHTIPSNYALEKILQLRGVSFEWNDDQTGYQRPDGIQIGFIAQEIQEVFPEKVKEDADGYLQTAYGDYDPLYVQAFKELVNEIQQLKDQNQLLLQRLEALEKQLNE